MNKDGHVVNSNPLHRKLIRGGRGGRAFRHALALAAAACLLSAAYAQEPDEDDDEDEVRQTQLEDAPVVPQTDLEDAPQVGQTDLEDAPVVPQTEVEEVVVTGSRLALTPNELAGNLVVLDRDYINATGEATLERVLRQLPQNLNATAERFGSSLNTGPNFSGASTVNLRGLGSESTLVLVDGKRIGHSGFLGGVTDVSSIPLSMVERVEVMLDGASAIYGSDAVGGVVNVITRKDYEGVELDLNYNWPADGGYSEWRGAVAGGFTFAGTRFRASFTHGGHSGLDGSDRSATLFQREIFAGPQFDIRFCCFPAGVHLPILYRLDGDVLTLPEYQALSEEDQARATAETHAVLPAGFNENSTVDDITQFGPPNWGVETQAGFHTLPESQRNGLFLSAEREFGSYLTGAFQVRTEQRETTYQLGHIGLSGQTFGANNPFNPFDRNVHLRGQRPDLGTVSSQTDTDTLDIGIDLDGAFGDSGWDWEADFGFSSTESDTDRVNTVDGARLRAGLTSDGVTPITQFLSGETAESCAEKGGSLSFGLCRVSVPPPEPVNPFGDFSAYIRDALNAGSVNEETRFGGLVRGRFGLFSAGDVRVLLGASHHTTSLDSATEFQVATSDAPIGAVSSLDTSAERANKAVYAEALMPVYENRQSLAFSFSARWDSYDAPDVTYREGDTPETPEDLPAPGSHSTWGVGVIYTPHPSTRIRMSRQTAFRAPQLNQLLLRTSQRRASGFGGLLVQQPNGSLLFATALINEGGNPDLRPETAYTSNVGFEVSPASLAGITLKSSWSSTRYEDRITRLVNTIIDPENLPSNTRYLAEEDIYFQERRWINASVVQREGLDHEVHFSRETDIGGFDVQVRYSRTLTYDVTVDPAVDEPASILRVATADTPLAVVSPSATNALLTWRHRGLEVGVDIEKRAKTTTTRARVTNVYTPPTVADLRLTYSFTPGGLLPAPVWAEGSRVSLAINNLTSSYGETRVSNADGEELEQQNADRSPLYGRVFNLSLHTSF